MSEIYSDPEKLRDFAQKLKSFADLVEGTMGDLNSRLGRLGDTWRDQEYDYFVNKFATIKKRLNRFVTETRNTAPLLERDAAALEEYRRVRLD
jgi:uncharacterized protein YukE